ncbi:MAG TPA: RluA family pseudouridine synthase [Turneriella sp.]|nr:RluA family pseudouridine synthase [Turneriella sp.]
MAKHAKDQKLRFELPAGERLDRFLAAALAEHGVTLSRSAIQRQIEQGGVEGLPAGQTKTGFRGKRPVEITFTLPAAQDKQLVPINAGIPVLYEDEYLAIVHKPPGMTVHPGAGTGNDTMVHALLGQFDKLSPHHERPGIVHRLDRETEGLMVIAKTEHARHRLSASFAERQIQKRYSALVWGSVTLPEEVSGYIWRDLKNRKKMKFGDRPPNNLARLRTAELLITEQVRHKFATELEIELITGRTHQIRATLEHYHAPLIGDAVYGDDAGKCRLYKIGKEKREKLAQSGMLLVARSLAFKHPFKRRNLEYAIELPERFAAARALLG